MTLATRDQIVAGDARLVSKGTNTRTHLTIHETGNPGAGANARAHANLQSRGNNRKASWHWTVDDHEAVRSYEHTAICWHAGSSVGSACSVAIEICINADGDQVQAYRNAAALAARICVDERIPLENVVQHNRWSGKNCPTRLRSGRPMDWATFLALVADEVGRLAGTTKPTPTKETTMASQEAEQIRREMKAAKQAQDKNNLAVVLKIAAFAEARDRDNLAIVLALGRLSARDADHDALLAELAADLAASEAKLQAALAVDDQG